MQVCMCVLALSFDLQGVAQGRPISNYCLSPSVHSLSFCPTRNTSMASGTSGRLPNLNSILPQALIFTWWIINGNRVFPRDLGVSHHALFPPFFKTSRELLPFSRMSARYLHLQVCSLWYFLNLYGSFYKIHCVHFFHSPWIRSYEHGLVWYFYPLYQC